MMLNIEYLTDQQGQTKAVVIPIQLWRKLLPQDDATEEGLAEAVENYCLSQAMDEAKSTPLLSKEDALKYLAE